MRSYGPHMTLRDYDAIAILFGFRTGEDMREWAEYQQDKDNKRQIKRYKTGA